MCGLGMVVPKIKKIEEVFGVKYDQIIFFTPKHGLTVNDKEEPTWN